jgi:hypothetical protein
MKWRSRPGRGQGGEGPGVLGRIPPAGAEHDAARAEAFDHVAAQVQALSLLRPLQSVAVVGSAADEVAAGLVAALCRAGLRVVEAAHAGEAVDADYVVVREPDGADVVVGASPAGARERPPAGAAGVVLTDASPAAEPERRPAGIVAAQALEQAAAAAPVLGTPVDDREAQLAARVEGLAKRERELARRVAEVAQRERALAAGDGGEAQLAARVEAVSRRERELARRVAELGARERAVEERERELERRRASLEELARTAVARAQGAAPVRHAAGDTDGPTIVELERLVADRAAAHPDRVEEWNSYLFFLREHADAHGRLAGNFRALVDDVFGDLR